MISLPECLLVPWQSAPKRYYLLNKSFASNKNALGPFFTPRVFPLVQIIRYPSLVVILNSIVRVITKKRAIPNLFTLGICFGRDNGGIWTAFRIGSRPIEAE
jgi:hypothetical protein